MKPKEKFIQNLLKEKFSLDNGKLKLDNPLTKDLQSAVKQLSEGLYTKQIHFLMELIQNAEDNDYKANMYAQLY
jgi:sacsin